MLFIHVFDFASNWKVDNALFSLFGQVMISFRKIGSTVVELLNVTI